MHAQHTVAINVVVTDKKGPVTDLQQSDFTVLDNGKPQPITSFQLRTKESPVQFVLLVDALNVPVPQVNYERSRIEAFLKSNGGVLPRPTQLAILTENGIDLEQKASTDGNALTQALEQQTTGQHAVSRSGAYNADDQKVQISLNALHSLGEKLASRPGRKIVLWISSGWPLLTDARSQNLKPVEQQRIYDSIVSLSNQLRDANITLESIDFTASRNDEIGRSYGYEVYLKGVSKLSETAMGDMALQVLALQSGWPGAEFNGRCLVVCQSHRRCEQLLRNHVRFHTVREA
jgi:VWFA-related protein